MAKRKITYYRVKLKKELQPIHFLTTVMNRIQQNIRENAAKKIRKSSRGLDLLMSHCELVDNYYYYCCIKLIRDEFPEVFDRKEYRREIIDGENDENKGIHEETHFVIFTNPKEDFSIFAIESSMRGPKVSDIEKFLNETLVNLNEKDAFHFEPFFAFDHQSLKRRIEEVADIKMMFHKDEIAQYSLYDKSTGALLEAASDYTDSEFVILEFKVNFGSIKKRYPTEGLKKRLWSFLDVLIKYPEARKHISKLDVKAQDKDYDGKLRLFDLIESKIASEVEAERMRPRSQYYHSKDLLHAIRARIDRDFRIKQSLV